MKLIRGSVKCLRYTAQEGAKKKNSESKSDIRGKSQYGGNKAGFWQKGTRCRICGKEYFDNGRFCASCTAFIKKQLASEGRS